MIETQICDLKKNFSPYVGKTVQIKGWIKSNRIGKKISFLVVNDGSGLDDLQIVYRDTTQSYLYHEIQKWNIGSAVVAEGKIEKAKNAQEIIELVLTKITLINQTNTDYFLQKKAHNLEFLRTHSELRARSRYYLAIFRIRNELTKAIHQFFASHAYHYLHTPIITNNDCEGGGEAFNIVVKNNEKKFFKKNAILSVSGQLHAEGIAQCLKKVYTFGPTFRADKSNTRFHSSEFWMIEPEIAFEKAKFGMDLAENLLKNVAEQVNKNNQKELKYLSEKHDLDLNSRIKNFINFKFIHLSYENVLEMLKKEKKLFQNDNFEWGIDLQKEHEHFICQKMGGPVFVVDYPKELKAFYMKQNSDGKTVAAFDLLVPTIGEMVGGSERENDFQKIHQRAKELNLLNPEIEWYLNLRKQGYAGSVGFGLGFDRLLMFLTGVKNIRDVIPFFAGFGVLNY